MLIGRVSIVGFVFSILTSACMEGGEKLQWDKPRHNEDSTSSASQEEKHEKEKTGKAGKDASVGERQFPPHGGLSLFLAIESGEAMKTGTDQVLTSLKELLEQLEKAGLDPRITVVGKNDLVLPADLPGERVRHFDASIDGKKGISKMTEVLAATDLPFALDNKSKVEVIFIVAHDGKVGDKDPKAEDFKAPFNLTPRISALLSPRKGKDAAQIPCGIEGRGVELQKLVTSTSGSLFEYCDNDLGELLKKLGTKIATRE